MNSHGASENREHLGTKALSVRLTCLLNYYKTKGRRYAWAVFWHHTAIAVDEFLKRMQLNDHERADVRQRVLSDLSVGERLNKFDSKKSDLFPWLSVLTKNAAIDYIRARNKQGRRLVTARADIIDFLRSRTKNGRRLVTANEEGRPVTEDDDLDLFNVGSSNDDRLGEKATLDEIAVLRNSLLRLRTEDPIGFNYLRLFYDCDRSLAQIATYYRTTVERVHAAVAEVLCRLKQIFIELCKQVGLQTKDEPFINLWT